MPTASRDRLKAVIMWPLPRLDRVQQYLANPESHEVMDGLSFLHEHAITTLVMDPSPKPWNPLARLAALFTGVDPLRLLRLLFKYRSCDVVISVDSSSCLLFVLVKRLLVLRKPLVVIDPALTPSYSNRMRMHQQVLPFAEHVVVFGEAQKEFLEKEYEGRVHCSFVRHRIDTEFFDSCKVTSNNQAEPFILAVGGDVGRDFRTLLSAAEGLQYSVLIHTKQQIAPPLPGNVRVRSDWITYEDLRALYAAASLIVVPLHKTLHASGINAVLEGMSMGKPVVVSASPGVLDYIEHGVNSWVVEPGNPASLRAGIETLLGDTQLGTRLGNGARKYCESNCTMRLYATEIARILRSVTVTSTS